MLTFGSLFAGIGGIDLGLERAGWHCLWQVEIDDYATAVLERHWPSVQRHRDIRNVGAHNLAPVRLVAGGFPCQDVSDAGKRTGIGGERSGLWSEYARVVRELRPDFVLVENVTGLLGRGFGRVLGDLAACGYDAEWQCIPAAAVGAPHIRDRVFILAYPCGFSPEQRRDTGYMAPAPGTGEGAGQERERHGDAAVDSRAVVADAALPIRGARRAWRSTPSGEGQPEPERSIPTLAHARSIESTERREPARESGWSLEAGQIGVGSSRGDISNPNGKPLVWTTEPWTECDPWDAEPEIQRVLDGIPARVVEPELRTLGNAGVPQVIEWLGGKIRIAAQGI